MFRKPVWNMRKIEFTAQEERLLASAKSVQAWERYKRSSLATGILFTLLFAGAVFAAGSGTEFSGTLAGVLAIYGVMTCIRVLHLRRMLTAYGSILHKIHVRLTEITGKNAEEISASDNGLAGNMILLTAFFVLLQLALYLLSVPYKLWLVSASVAFFLLLTAVIKCRYAGRIMELMELCTELRQRF